MGSTIGAFLDHPQGAKKWRYRLGRSTFLPDQASEKSWRFMVAEEEIKVPVLDRSHLPGDRIWSKLPIKSTKLGTLICVCDVHLLEAQIRQKTDKSLEACKQFLEDERVVRQIGCGTMLT